MNHFYVSMCVFALLSLCGILLVSSNIERWKKIVVLVSVIVAGTMSYRAMNTLYGLPTLLQSDIDETLILGFYPNKADEKIYIWLKKPGDKYPTSFVMPYSSKLHGSLERARKKFKGVPYRANIKSNNYPLEKFDETVGEVEVEGIPMIPPKTEQPME